MNNRNMIALLLVLIFVMVFISFIFSYIINKKMKERESYSIYLYGKRKNHNIYLNLYDFFSQWFVTRKYLKTIVNSIEIYTASESQEISGKSMKLALKIWIIDFTLFIYIFLRNPSVFTLVLSIMYIVILSKQIFYITLDRGHLQLLKQLDNFLEEVRHNFQVHGMIDEAIFDSLTQIANPMKNHGQKIYDILNASDIQEEVAKYNEVTPNRFLKLFLSLCVMMITYGDKRTKGTSLFLINLRYLRQEVSTEILNRERIRHVFSGLITIALMPVLFLKVIENWAINSLPEMERYYKSLYGILTSTLIFLFTYVSYVLINRLKENYEYEKHTSATLEFLSNIPFINHLLNKILYKNYGKTLRMKSWLLKTGEPYTCLQFFMKRILYGLFGFCLCTFVIIFAHWNNKNQVLTNYSYLNYLNSGISQSQVIVMQEVMKENVLLFNKDKDLSIGEVEKNIKEDGRINNKQYVDLIAGEVISRVHYYKNEYYKWYELVISTIASVLFYQIPYLHLLFIKKLREKNMEDEIVQFHTIILMLIHIDKVTIEIVLEWLEDFAVIFKGSIERLRNEIKNGEMEILEDLRLNESFQPFVKIIENLQISDRIGIEKAFDEIEIDRINYQEKRKMDNEMNLQDKTSLGKVIAFIPFMITIGLYLILPFMIKGMSTFMGYMEQIN